jgi:hypothetical protein
MTLLLELLDQSLLPIRAHASLYIRMRNADFGSLACIVSLADQIKGEARQAIDALRAMGIEVLLAFGKGPRGGSPSRHDDLASGASRPEPSSHSGSCQPVPTKSALRIRMYRLA